MTKLSEAMSTALYRIHDHAWSGANPRTVEALIKRGLLVQEADRPVLTDAGRKAIGVEESNKSVEAELPEWEQELLAEMSEDKAAIIREEMETESSESNEDAPVVPFFNRAALRQMRRNIARVNRATMRNHGKRIRKYGILLDPKYVARKLAA